MNVYISLFISGGKRAGNGARPAAGGPLHLFLQIYIYIYIYIYIDIYYFLYKIHYYYLKIYLEI